MGIFSFLTGGGGANVDQADTASDLIAGLQAALADFREDALDPGDIRDRIKLNAARNRVATMLLGAPVTDSICAGRLMILALDMNAPAPSVVTRAMDEAFRQAISAWRAKDPVMIWCAVDDYVSALDQQSVAEEVLLLTYIEAILPKPDPAEASDPVQLAASIAEIQCSPWDTRYETCIRLAGGPTPNSGVLQAALLSLAAESLGKAPS